MEKLTDLRLPSWIIVSPNGLKTTVIQQNTVKQQKRAVSHSKFYLLLAFHILNRFIIFSPYRLLIRAVVKAREACRLKTLTGGSVVVYGIPVFNDNSVIEKPQTCDDDVQILN